MITRAEQGEGRTMIDFLSNDAVFLIAIGYVGFFTVGRFYFGQKLMKVATQPMLKTYLFKPAPLVAMFVLADLFGEHSAVLKAVATTLCMFVMFHAAFKIGCLRGSLARHRLGRGV
jgi:hypothetical protein